MSYEVQNELARRCAEAIGADPETDVLCQVLARFPDTAELFIKTMKYAEEVMGKKALFDTIEHKHSSFGFQQLGSLRKGEIEHLGKHGYTGERIRKFIYHIDRLRGKGSHGILDFYADGNGECEAIVAIFDNEENNICDEELTSMIKIMLLVMAVSPNEIVLIREAIEVTAVSNDLVRESGELQRQAQVKEDQARNVRLSFSERLNLIYPRRTEESYKK